MSVTYAKDHSMFIARSRRRKEAILNLCEFHGCGALLVVVRHVIDPRAHRGELEFSVAAVAEGLIGTLLAPAEVDGL
jgi:hypothetical protein